MNTDAYGRLRPEELDELRARLIEHCDTIAISYWGEPLVRTRSELRWGHRNGSLCLALHPRHKRGLWLDRGGDAKGDMLAVAISENGGVWARAVEDVCRRVGYLPPSCAEADQDLTPEQRARREQAAAADRERREARQAKAAEKAKREEQQDQNRRIKVAQFIASHGAAIAPGSLADRYLAETRGIPRSIDGWPDVVRFLEPWSDLPAAVALIATDATGRICGVQKVEIRETDGRVQKLRKVSRGAFATTGGVVRLPGDPAGPLQIAEGPETALSCWVATGYETWICLGGIARLPLPKDRLVLACRDDDAQSSPADKSFRRAVAEWQQSGHTVRIATPWDVRRYDRSDFNDVIKANGVDAVRARIEAALVAPAFKQRVPVHEARQSVRRVVNQFTDIVRNHREGDPVAVLAAKIGVAIGKSSISREELVLLLQELRKLADERSIAILVPTHRLGSQAADSLNLLDVAQAAGLTAAIWRGRQAADPRMPGKAMCYDTERVEDVMRSYMDVENSCCKKRFLAVSGG